jgi:hypothetical protein
LEHFPLTPKSPLVTEVRSRLAGEPFFGSHPPAAKMLCSVLNAAFWASVQSEEGRSVRVALALKNPNSRAPDVLRLSEPVEVSSHSITKLSASFPFRRGTLVVTLPPGGLPTIWGVALPKLEDGPLIGWLVEIIGPGYVVVRNGLSIQAALLPDGSRKVFEANTRVEDDWCNLLMSQAGHTVLGREPSFGLQLKFYGFLQVLSRAMVDHRRGGSVVFVSPRDKTWDNSIEFTYKFDTPKYLSSLCTELKAYLVEWERREDRERKTKNREREPIRFYPPSDQERTVLRALRLVGGLTAVDGALVMNTDLEILGYGAKLRAHTEQLIVREWFSWGEYAKQPRHNIGGTRHRSAAEFVARHPDTVTFVASQDGRFTIFWSSKGGGEVLAHRVELLLL